MIEVIIEGVIENWYIVLASLFMLVGGTIAAYRKFGLKRVLLGKTNEDRELVYRREDESIVWKETLKTWRLILTGGMSLFTLFLIFMILILSAVYAIDIKATRVNDELLCREFGTVSPTQEQMEVYYGVREVSIENIILVGAG